MGERLKSEIKKRIEQIQKGMASGEYKETKAGIVPDDWEVKQLSKIAREIKRKNDGEKHPVLTISSLTGFLEQGKRFSKVIAGENLAKYTMLEENEFAYNRGNSKTYPQGCIFRLENYSKALIPNVYISFRIEEGNINYYKYYFSAGLLGYQLSKIINTGVRNDGLFNLCDKDFFACQVRCPPLSEQKKIAEMLNVWGWAIELKEKLILEKKQQKKWLIQNLLTGDKRIPGFNGHWKKFELEKVISLSSNKIAPINEKQVFKCIELEHIESGTGRLLGSTLSSRQKSHKNRFKNGDVLFGKLRPYLKKFYFATHEGVCSSEIWVMRPNAEYLLPQFLYYIVQSSRFIEKCCVSSGSKMPRADWDYVLSLVIHLPPLPEQTVIAKILATIDCAIDLHEKQLEELKKQKKALMQLLLTGIVRVNVEKVD